MAALLLVLLILCSVEKGSSFRNVQASGPQEIRSPSKYKCVFGNDKSPIRSLNI